jgi:ABC-type sugar transport system substrate-binding protein
MGALLVGLSVLIAACGSSSSSSSSSEPATTSEPAESEPAESESEPAESESSGSSIVAKAEEEVEKLSNLKTIQSEIPKPAANETFEPGTGTAQIVSCSQAAGGCRSFSALITSALQDMGWTVPPTYDGAFEPSKEAAGIEKAVQEGDDAIVLVSVDYNSVKAAIDKAHAANIPIVCFNCVSEGYDEITDVGQLGNPQGESIAWYIVAATEGKANVVGFEDSSFKVVKNRFVGIENVFSQCPECKFKKVQVTGAALAEPGPPQWTAALQENPELNFGIPPYDAFVESMSTTAKQHGGEVLVSGNDGYPEVLEKMVLPDSNIPDNYVSAIPYSAYATADIVGRKAAGESVWKGSENIPSLLVTGETVEKYLPSGYYEPGFDYKAFFHKLWGK